MLPNGWCFLGLAIDADENVEWLRAAVQDLLDRHERVLLLLETELDSYDQGVEPPAEATDLPPAAMTEQLADLTMRRWRAVDAVRHRFPASTIGRVQIATWSNFVDPTFASLWRRLLTAFGVGATFRRDVLRLGNRRLKSWRSRADSAQAARAASLRAIESLAMRLRIGEVAGYHHEYGRERESPVAERLYKGHYAEEGLTVASLVGHPARRSFRELT